MKHVFAPERIAGLLNAERGLTASEVEARRMRYGVNDILPTQPSGWRAVLRDTAGDPMVWFLAATALLFAFLDERVEAAILALAIVPIAGMDAYLHHRTQATTEALAGRLAPYARVVRQHRVAEIPAIDLVPGDLVIVTEGEPFPADGLIVAGAALQVDESTLTGEAMPVRKRPFTGALHTNEEAAVDSAFWAAAGTRLLTGEARLRVVFTGADTVYGAIVRSAQQGQREPTPLQSAIGALVNVLVVIALAICVTLAVTRYYQGFGLLDAFLSAATLAVAALPEEFPVVFSFFLGLGVYRLARRQALVRRAVVVENIGRVTCICADKTGTITEGRLRLTHLLPAGGTDPTELRRIAAVASRPGSGDPMDIAVLDNAPPVHGARLATFPFTEDRRREVGLIQDDGQILAAAKGAPETILAMCETSAEERASWLAQTEQLAAAGHKVIAVAEKRLAEWAGGEPDRQYRFAGLLAFEDPVRAGVKEAVARAQAAGIRVIMVTGDHVATAATIAGEVGIGADKPRVIEGAALNRHLRERGGLADFDVVARAMPAQKLDLVRALKAAGEIVAVTGDGINDVPALQGADIGIAMGERGTRTAREVASIVLMDDNFRTIVQAIAEGRQLFRNLKLSFAYLLMTHMPLVATAALVPFAGFPLLYLPMHVVWLELIIHPTALLVFQALPPAGELAPIRRHRTVRFFNWREWTVIALVGGLVTFVIFAGYVRSLGPGYDVEHARAMALAALNIASATITASLSTLKTRSAILAVAATLGSALALLQIPPLAAAMHLRPLHFDDWLVAAGGGLFASALAALLPPLAEKS